MLSPEVLVGPTLPVRLRDLREPPTAMYLRGALPRGPAVAVVGTRDPSGEAVEFTRDLAAALAAEGVAIYSGGAKGIDLAAHEGTLEAGGATVVVAPAGFHRPFPEDHGGVFHRIVERGGAYLSAFPDDEPARLGHFLLRNAHLAALVHALVVVQCDFRSGARNAARRARELGRVVFAVPHSPWFAEGAGCNRELERGAIPLRAPAQVLSALAQQNLRGLAPGAPGPGHERHEADGEESCDFR